MALRRGVLSAGTWCVDLNKSIPAWPPEDTMTYIVELDRQGGGDPPHRAPAARRKTGPPAPRRFG